jgi:hypothetical protein
MSSEIWADSPALGKSRSDAVKYTKPHNESITAASAAGGYRRRYSGAR